MKKFLQAILLVLVVTLPISASGYIPSADFIIKMMLKGKRGVNEIRVEQIATIFDEDFGFEDIEVSEVIYLKFPDRYRLDINFPYEKKSIISHKGKSVIIVGGEAISDMPDEENVFLEFFVIQSVDKIFEFLHSKDINTERMGLGRFDGKIAYIIGAKEGETNFPQLWIDRDTFLPTRFMVEKNNEDSAVTYEIRFSNYRHIDGKLWYPSTIEFLYDNRLIMRYQTEKVVVNTYIPDDLFDISKFTENSP